jgi:PKD repeat protein
MSFKAHLRKLVLIALLTNSWLPAIGQYSVHDLNDKSTGIQGFIENKGQVTDQNGNPRPDVKFIYATPGFKLILKGNSFSYELISVEKKNGEEGVSEATGRPLADERKPAEYSIKNSRIDIELSGANPKPEIITEGRSEAYNNYYLAHTPEEGITAVYGYSTVTYRNVYDHIDFVFRASGDKLKYDIVVRRGGKLSDVKMVYNGMQSLNFSKRKLACISELGSITETIPSSYLQETGFPIKADYKLVDGKVCFDANYDKNNTLVVDPIVAWGTYYGGGLGDEIYGVDADTLGNVYAAGATAGSYNIATSGSFKSTVNSSGLRDAFLVKFNKKGVRQWGTYYGGDGEEKAYSVAADKLGNVFMSGYTSSNSGISTSGAFKTSYSGGLEIFLVKFNSSGSRKWGTYFGGDEYEAYVATDLGGNVIMTGQTKLSSGLASSGAYQTSYGGGHDGFVAKFSASGARKWATYYGGSDLDVAYKPATDAEGNVYVPGITYSKSGIASTGAYQTSLKGKSDGFLCKFDSNGVRKWATYYGGDSTEAITSVGVDKSMNVFFTGYTYSSSGVATSGIFQNSFGGGDDAFVAKFDSSGKRKWATYYGGTSYEGSSGLVVDNSTGIYVTGNTSSSGMATSDGYKTSLTGATDIFLAKFDTSGGRKWATYYGGSSNDYPAGIAIDISSNVFIGGYTTSNSGIATTGAHQTTFYGGCTSPWCYSTYDGFVLRFAPFIADAGIVKASVSKNNSCLVVNDTIKFRIKNFGDTAITSLKVGYSLNGKNGGTFTYSLSLKPGDTTAYLSLDTATFNKRLNTLKIWASLPNGIEDDVASNDTLKYTVTIYPRADINFSVGTACKYRGTNFTNASTSYSTSVTWLWYFGDGTISTATSPTKIYSSAGTYTAWLVAIDNGCRDSISKTVTVNDVPSVGLSGKTSVCQYSKGNLYIAKVPAGTTLTWAILGGAIVSGQGDDSVYVNWSGTGTGMLSVKASTGGCDTAVSMTISINPKPTPSIAGKQQPCMKKSESYVVAPKTGNAYKWEVTGGNIVSGQGTNVLYVKWSAGIGGIKLTQTNAQGCDTTVSLSVFPYPVPVLGFSVSPACTGAAMPVQNTSDAATVFSYLWQFGDGTTSTSASPVKAYTTPGKYTITLIGYTKLGCSDTVRQDVTIYPRPKTVFAVQNTCAGEPVSFSNSSNVSAGSIDSYTWDFGDGTSSADSVPFKIYSQPGTYTVKLWTGNASGCVDSASMAVTIYPRAAVSFTAPNSCGNKGVVFTDQSSIAKGKIVGRLWKFGDGSTSTQNNVTKYYAAAGAYTVTLIETTDKGCQDSATKIVTIYASPKADFTSADVCLGATNNFINTSSVPSGSTVKYTWTFDGADTTHARNPSYAFRDTGDHTALLIVETNTGCRDSLEKNIKVYALPQVSISKITHANDVNFSVSDSTLDSYSWDFGDGKSSTVKNPIHTYSATGTYTVKLKVTNANGCEKTVIDTVNIKTIGIDYKKPSDFHVTVYPNPFTNSTTLEYELIKPAKTEARLYDMQGKEIAVLVKSAKQNAGKYTYEISADRLHLKPGTYMIRLLIDGQVRNEKVIKLQ